jgi:hypothetical protein
MLVHSNAAELSARLSLSAPSVSLLNCRRSRGNNTIQIEKHKKPPLSCPRPSPCRPQAKVRTMNGWIGPAPTPQLSFIIPTRVKSFDSELRRHGPGRLWPVTVPLTDGGGGGPSSESASIVTLRTPPLTAGWAHSTNLQTPRTVSSAGLLGPPACNHRPWYSVYRHPKLWIAAHGVRGAIAERCPACLCVCLCVCLCACLCACLCVRAFVCVPLRAFACPPARLINPPSKAPIGPPPIRTSWFLTQHCPHPATLCVCVCVPAGHGAMSVTVHRSDDKRPLSRWCASRRHLLAAFLY